MGSQLNHAALEQMQDREWASISITWIMGANQSLAMIYALQSTRLWMIPAVPTPTPADAFTSADCGQIALDLWQHISK